VPLSEADRTAIRAAELRLLDPAVRGNADTLDVLLADDFEEIGASGRRYTKAEVIAALAAEPAALEIDATDLEISELGEDLALAQFRTTSRADASAAPREALRTSIWRREGGGWRIRFHQGTPADRRR
jgi:hypothetical protein